MDLSACQSHSLRTSVVNSSRLSGQEQVTTQNQLVLQEITEEGRICQSQETESNHVHITESLFEGCQKCNGIIGVPLTYLASHCNHQFKIIKSCDRGDSFYKTKIYTKNDGKNWSDINRGATLLIDGEYRNMYHRILIQRKESE